DGRHERLRGAVAACRCANSGSRRDGARHGRSQVHGIPRRCYILSLQARRPGGPPGCDPGCDRSLKRGDMSKTSKSAPDQSRRDLLKTMAAGALGTVLVPGLLEGAAQAAEPASGQRTKSADGPYNILLFLTDQERYFGAGELPGDYRLPARERL